MHFHSGGGITARPVQALQCDSFKSACSSKWGIKCNSWALFAGSGQPACCLSRQGVVVATELRSLLLLTARHHCCYIYTGCLRVFSLQGLLCTSTAPASR